MALSRRELLRFGGVGASAVLVGAGAVSSGRFAAPRRIGGDPFTLGVASGDPAPDGVVLWTRLAPDPLAPDGHGGMALAPVSVDYEVAHDEYFRQVVARGTVVATRELGHSVHPEVGGLEADRWYFYRFRVGSAISPVGRTRTAPTAGQAVSRLRFAFASCQSWPSGYFTAYEHMSAEDLDLVVHLGDYIYERGWRWGRLGTPVDPGFRDEVFDLAGYRLRYAQAKSEGPLRAAHAAFPWLVTMDDHEVDNNWAGDTAGIGIDVYRVPAMFRRRRAAAFQAMYEHQPLRRAQMPSGPDILLHRRYRYGDLAEITMIDTRQYRNKPACEPGLLWGGCTDPTAADRTILGARQRDWLLDGFSSSNARWQVIGNQVAMARSDYDPGPGVDLGSDGWDGYVADRNRVLGGASARGVRNLVVLTGDRHHNYAADLRRDYAEPESPIVGAEFTGTSITSGGNGSDMNDTGRDLLAANPDLKFFNGQRGYVRVEVDHRLWRSDFRVVPYIDRPGAGVETRAGYVVEDGVPGVTAATAPSAPAVTPAHPR
ncbi:alkaline phosphatase D family protein [Nocardia yamanashiensis]|uniref:alkaline phosphatase D family protein n=1 Tax=Nocardia yamanashiensis TaxID=209247 RepID=UPI001E46154A|nr:alkaline phosphatase D family protein [Nocardia yamanashiensis]UGT45392.1 alkaline phosphatase D family protein [Nocardia yamanashiensis]